MDKASNFLIFFKVLFFLNHLPLSVEYQLLFLNLLSTVVSFLLFAIRSAYSTIFYTVTATPSRNNNLFLCSAFTSVIYPAYSQPYKPENTVLMGCCLPSSCLIY